MTAPATIVIPSTGIAGLNQLQKEIERSFGPPLPLEGSEYYHRVRFQSGFNTVCFYPSGTAHCFTSAPGTRHQSLTNGRWSDGLHYLGLTA